MFRNWAITGRGYARMFCIASTVATASTIGLSSIHAQVLPPPALPGQAKLATTLVEAFSRKDATIYASLLADNLQVYDNGQEVASSKKEWMESFGKKISAPGVQFKLVSGYSSTGRLLFIEYFNSLASWGRKPPPDCCWSFDAVAYDLADGKIIKIQRLRGGDSRLDDKGQPIGK